MKTKKNLLTRSNVRDVVLLCSLASSVICGHSIITTAIGFCLLAIGCFLHIVAKGVLIRNVVLCDSGIYGLVRHPYYLANYLIDSGFCVLSGNLYLAAAYPFLFFWSYGPTLRQEERFLASKYGSTFQEDSFNIPQVFPDRASLKSWGRLLEGFSVKRITLNEYARITRFCSAGFAIMFVHAVDLRRLSSLFNPTRDDYDAFSFMLLAAAFFLLSLVFMLIRHTNRDAGESSYDARPLS